MDLNKKTESTGEFDIQITDVTLVHKNSFVKSFKYDDYLGGRKDCGLVFCVSGSGVFDFGEETVILSAGEVMFLAEGSKYSVRNKEEDPFVHYTVNFRVSNWEGDLLSTEAKLMSGRARYKTSASNANQFKSKFENLHRLWFAKRLGWSIAVRGELYSLIFEYFDVALGNLFVSDTEKQLKKAMNLLNILNLDMTCAELAEECGFSESHFRRLWKEWYGVSPMEYKKELRVQCAKILLSYDTYTNIKQVAESVGYDDPNYFARIFKQSVGMSPTEYAKYVVENGFGEKSEEVCY